MDISTDGVGTPSVGESVEEVVVQVRAVVEVMTVRPELVREEDSVLLLGVFWGCGMLVNF